MNASQHCAAVILTLLVACTTASDDAGVSRFVGTWNYDLPDAADGSNIAWLDCPGGGKYAIPQIGNITFEPGDDAGLASRPSGPEMVGTTDQGCTWTFAVDGDDATFHPPQQTCFNEVIGSSYTIAWSIALDGDSATEVITGTSHQPTGDCEFTLEDGRRSRVERSASEDPTTPFVGTWDYDAPDLVGTNVAQVLCGTVASYEPRFGSIEVTKSGDRRITARTDQGCSFTFDTEQGTALLMPPGQSCTADDGSEITMAFWSMAADGRRANEFSRAERADDTECVVLLAAGTLTKR